MDTAYLREFLVMSELCNYTAAADAMFISQPTLYKHIKSLETEVGVPLFEKQGKKIILSRYGKMLIPRAQRMLDERQQYLNDVEADLLERSNALRIGTNYNIKDLTKAFFLENRKYKIQVNLNESLESSFSDPDCELALFCCAGEPDSGYEHIKYCDDEVVAVLHTSHPLAQRSSIRIDELRNEDFIAPSSNAYQFTIPSFQFSGVLDRFQPKISINAERGSEAAQMVSQGFGISLLFRRTIESLPLDNLALVSLSPIAHCSLYLYWRKNSDLSDGAKNFIEYVKVKSERN